MVSKAILALPTRRAQIMEAAAALFRDQGFHETSMEDIAEAVGIKKPTLYHHVKSKAQIVAWIHDECYGAIGPPLVGYLKSGMSPAQILRRVAIDIFSLLEQRPGYLQMFFEHHRDLDSRDRSRIAKKRDQYFDDVRRTIEIGNEANEFNVGDPKLAAMAFFGMCNWGYQWYRPDGSGSARDVGEYVWSIFVGGALAPGPERIPASMRADEITVLQDVGQQ